MNLRQFIIAGVVSCSLAPVAFAEQTVDTARTDPTKPPSGGQALQPEPESAAAIKAGRGQEEPNAQVKAKNEGAHSPAATTTSDQAAVASGYDRQMVRQAQEKLKEQGYNAGAADGVYGPKTRAALKDFQRSQNIDPSGRLDEETLAGLGIESEGAAGSARGEATEQSSGSATGAVQEADDEEKLKPGAPESKGAR